MIATKTIKIEKIDRPTSVYIESELESKGYDVLRWAITGVNDKYYILDIAVVQNL